MALYDIQGNTVSVNVTALNYDKTVKGIAHRGYSTVAPENTIPAFKLAKQMGFNYVECDVQFTSDSVPVLLHNSTINATSDGEGNVSDFTWDELQQYDFGSWKSPIYTGTKIPSFEQFIALCRDIALHPYIELKLYTCTEEKIQGLVDIVTAYGMKGKVTWISMDSGYLGYIKDYDPSARLGYVVGDASTKVINNALGIKTSTNEVFLDSNGYSDEVCTTCMAAGIPLEVWTLDNESAILQLNPYVTGVTSNSKIAGKVLYEANIG